jgi:hypothetical protein
MNSLFNRYRPQGILTLLQTGVILAGSLSTRALLKAQGYPRIYLGHWEFSIFVRDWALLFVLIPVMWCFGSIKFEENSSTWSQRTTFITGVVLLLLLAGSMMRSIGLATLSGSGVIRTM